MLKSEGDLTWLDGAVSFIVFLFVILKASNCNISIG